MSDLPYIPDTSSRPMLRPSLSGLRSPSVRIRRFPSSSAVPTATPLNTLREHDQVEAEYAGRRRSISEPQPARDEDEFRSTNDLIRHSTATQQMPTLVEETTPSATTPLPDPLTTSDARPRAETAPSRLRRGLTRGRSKMSVVTPADEYDAQLVDYLDLIDPEVSTLSTLTNVQNSLFVPDLGRFLNRMPTYELSRRPISTTPKPPTIQIQEPENPRKTVRRSRGFTDLVEADTLNKRSSVRSKRSSDAGTLDRRGEEEERDGQSQTMSRHNSLNSVLSESRFAVLPHGASLSGWTEEDKAELNDHVRHLLHSRREKFKRSMRGFGQYVRKPLGFFVTVYAFLITVFGLIWVLFLIGWISGGEKHSYDVNVIDNVLVALFAVIGDGLIPFRIVDTYHMIYIAHYHHLTWRLRREQQLPSLPDRNDLPLDPMSKDLEAGPTSEHEAVVLTPKQQGKLEHHQAKYSKSHTFYKPHETYTHHAFPVHYLIAVTVLLDLHSCFQVALGTCTWAINYHVRPEALTATILCCSIACNITAGILISFGDKLSRKQEVVDRIFRQELTEEAMAKVDAKRRQGVESDF